MFVLVDRVISTDVPTSPLKVLCRAPQKTSGGCCGNTIPPSSSCWPNCVRWEGYVVFQPLASLLNAAFCWFYFICYYLLVI